MPYSNLVDGVVSRNTGSGKSLIIQNFYYLCRTRNPLNRLQLGKSFEFGCYRVRLAHYLGQSKIIK